MNITSARAGCFDLWGRPAFGEGPTGGLLRRDQGAALDPPKGEPFGILYPPLAGEGH